MPDIPDAIVDAAMAAEVEYARTRRPDGRGHAMPPRDQVRRLLEAAEPVLRRELAAHILMLDELERGYRCPACHERAASSGDDGSAVCGCGHRWVKPPWPDRSRLMLAVLEAAAAGEPVPGLPPKGGTRA